VVIDHAVWDDWYVVQPDVLHDCAGLSRCISLEHRTDRGCSLAVRGCLTMIVLECSISNTSPKPVRYSILYTVLKYRSYRLFILLML
jgi:hypothetical protein